MDIDDPTNSHREDPVLVAKLNAQAEADYQAFIERIEHTGVVQYYAYLEPKILRWLKSLGIEATYMPVFYGDSAILFMGLVVRSGDYIMVDSNNNVTILEEKRF